MDAEFQQKMAILSGQVVQKQKPIELSNDEKQKLSANYFKLFFGLTLSNWLAGNTLGASWHKALSQVESYVNSKNANSPAAMYIRQIHAAHRAKWSKTVMTNPHREDKINCTPEKEAKWKEFAAKDIKSGLDAMNEILAKYQAKEANKDMPKVSYVDAQKQLQLIMMRQVQNKLQNAA